MLEIQQIIAMRSLQIPAAVRLAPLYLYIGQNICSQIYKYG